jgi:hypothetical protein
LIEINFKTEFFEIFGCFECIPARLEQLNGNNRWKCHWWGEVSLSKISNLQNKNSFQAEESSQK